MAASRLRFLCGSLTMCVLLGCGDGSKYAPVTGTVTLNGEPLADAYVVFQPQNGAAEKASTGKTDASGNYALTVIGTQESGALVGRHRVQLTTVAPDAMEDELSKLPRDRIPSRYQLNPPTFKVSPERSNQADFDLKS